MLRRTIFLIAMLVWPVMATAQTNEISADPDRMEQRIKALSAYGADASGATSRVAFSEADLAGRKYIMGLMREAGLNVRVDTAGNIIGRREGSDESLSPIMFGWFAYRLGTGWW